MARMWIASTISLFFVHSSLAFLVQNLIADVGKLEDKWVPDAVCAIKLPKPWPLSTINPDVLVYTRTSNTKFKAHGLSDVPRAVSELDDGGYFAAGRQVVFIVHGYLNNHYFPWIGDMKDAVLKEEDSTVFTIGWGFGAVTPSYPQAGSNTQTVAQLIAAIADAISISNTFKGDASQLYLYCIGHSLGAQVCGQAGRLSGNFNRVTGLDPAGPGYEDCWTNMHIDTDSAACVDNIHTDGSRKGHLDPFVAHYGTLDQWGHIDFYPNGGAGQPGCHETNDFACSHMKAISFFTYTIGKKDVCSAFGTCADSHDLPGSCGQNVTQSMGYYSTCHKASEAVKEGMFYLATEKRGNYC